MLAPTALQGQRGAIIEEMFKDRRDAGKRLGAALAGRLSGDVIVLGIPRGGVVVAEEVAAAIGAGLDIVVPRKIGAPGNAELAIGAVAPGVQVWDEMLIDVLDVTRDYLESEVAAQEEEMTRRALAFRGARPQPTLNGRTVVVVDDGIATGATAVAAVRWVRGRGAATVIVAVPVAAGQSVARLTREADEVVVLDTPSAFHSVGEFYEVFGQTSDEEVVAALARAEKGLK